MLCFGLEATASGTDSDAPLPVEEAVALRFAVGAEAREASVEVVLVARPGEPIGRLCCCHHRAQSVLCKNTVTKEQRCQRLPRLFHLPRGLPDRNASRRACLRHD